MRKVNWKGWRSLLIIILLAGHVGCSDQSDESKQDTLFRLVPVTHSNLDFNNQITETDTFNVLNFEYFYNGSGVGLGDVNGDGLLDIYFGGNMVSSRLYLNQGGLKFKDVTEKAGVSTERWSHGISMVDINQDGKLDIYISTINPFGSANSENLFFINQGNNESGIPVFLEMAADLGLADSSFSTQSAFFDYDLDGDLDMYLLTNSLELFVRSNPIGQRHDGTGRSVDKLFQNTGTDENGLPQFRDVSEEAGILAEGWGLGVVVSDINRDGYPDVYVANDFMANDHVYINNQDGTFSDMFRTMLKHQEMNGMGVDMADLNNDGLNEIVVVDMLPEDNLRQKTMFSNIQYDRFRLTLERNYQPQYVRNVLQLNNGDGTFSDIGLFSGIYATDWSWSPLIADFDNDGWRDIYISNGYVKDVTDLDFTSYAAEAEMFGTKEARIKKLIDATKNLEGIDKPNLMYRNNHDLTFTNVAEEWGLSLPSYSHGAAYGDLDNDGDLDIVTNNMNSLPFLFENTGVNKEVSGGSNNYIRFNLEGNKGNLGGAGASILVYTDGKLQYAEKNQQRGYKSTVDPAIHFGLGNTTTIDSVTIEWPGHKIQKLTNVEANQVLTLKESDAIKAVRERENAEESFFKRINPEKINLTYTQTEKEFADFKINSLLPRKHSQQGPALVSGDINGDQRTDLLLGGSANESAVVFVQNQDGSYKQSSLTSKVAEDIGMLLFDADGDGDVDLYCVSGSSEFGRNTGNYQDRLYINDGSGNFTLGENLLPEITASGSCVVGQDYDKDGDIDLFVGGRIQPGRYPYAPDSYILENDGSGRFTDVTDAIAPQIRNAGMVTSAIWTDFDNDGWTDLLVVGEFMPVTFFRNEGGERFETNSNLTIENSSGWWNSVTGGDIDNDGDIDYVLGNLGLNSIYKASPDEPVCVYAKDFDSNGSMDPVLCRYIEGKEYPVHPRETLTSQIVPMKKILRTYDTYGSHGFKEIFTEEMLEDALILKANEFRSSILLNNGDAGFQLLSLPDAAQFAPMFGTLLSDVNNDGNLDITSVGNDYSFEPLTGLYDAGIGNCLLGDGKGNFQALHVQKSGFRVDGDAKAIISTPAGGQKLIIVSQNSDSLVIHSDSGQSGTYRSLNPGEFSADLYLNNGQKRKTEFYLGESYLSQSARIFEFPANADSVVVFDTRGGKRVVRKE